MAFIVATNTAFVQITAGISLLVIPLVKTSTTSACTTIQLTIVTVTRNWRLFFKQSVEGKINELCSSMYSKEQHENLLYDFGKSVDFINQWKCHVLRCENLIEDSVFIVMDWAMKFLQRWFREKQCNWYVKRGMNWHVNCAIRSDGKGKFFVSFYNHLFNSCSQDWFSVLSILETLLITVRSSCEIQR